MIRNITKADYPWIGSYLLTLPFWATHLSTSDYGREISSFLVSIASITIIISILLLWWFNIKNKQGLSILRPLVITIITAVYFVLLFGVHAVMYSGI